MDSATKTCEVTKLLQKIGVMSGKMLIFARHYPEHPQYKYVDLVRVYTNGDTAEYEDEIGILAELYAEQCSMETRYKAYELPDDNRVLVSLHEVDHGDLPEAQKGITVIFTVSLDAQDKRWVHGRFQTRNALYKLVRLAFQTR